MDETKETMNTMGTFTVQYTDNAQQQIESLDEGLCDTVQDKVRMMAAVNPYAHGVQIDGTPDRRRACVDGTSVRFWISKGVRILTVVDVVRDGLPQMEKPEPLVESDEEDEGMDE